MKGIVKAVVAVALGLAVVAAPASAQAKKKAAAPAPAKSSSKITWNGGVGLTLPSTSGLNTGFNLRFGANFTPNGWPVWIRPEAMFDHMGCSGGGCSWTVIGLAGDAGYNIKTTSNIGPYVMGGLNILHQNVSVTGFGSGSQTKLGINLGGGITFPFSGKKAYAEIRYVSAGGGLDFIPISVGLMF